MAHAYMHIPNNIIMDRKDGPNYNQILYDQYAIYI